MNHIVHWLPFLCLIELADGDLVLSKLVDQLTSDFEASESEDFFIY